MSNSVELDLFGEPVSKVPIPLARKELVELQKEEIKDDPPTLPIDFKQREIESIVKEGIPGGTRTTIWNK